MPNTVNTAVEPEKSVNASANSVSVLRELFELLQEYAPMWYTEELHNRMASALGAPEFEPSV